VSTSAPPPKGSESATSIYAPGASKSSGIRVHVGIKDIVYIVSILVGGGLWLQNRASKEDLVTLKAECVAAASSAAAAASTPLATRIDVLERAVKKDGKRWDRLDAFHSQVKVFNKANETKPPKFGPKAEKMGELPQDWDLE
jgi:hypothetical protein